MNVSHLEFNTFTYLSVKFIRFSALRQLGQYLNRSLHILFVVVIDLFLGSY